LAAVGAGTRLLDLGCGPGVLARVAADRGAHVVGVDADRSAIALAAAAVPEGTFRVGDVHELPEPDGSVDVVTAVQLLTHVANPLKVLRAAARVLARPRGVMLATVWGRERECDMRGFGEALAEWLPGRRPPAGPPPLTEPDRLRKLAGLADLTVVTLDEVRCRFGYPDADALLDPLLASGIGRHALARAGPAAVRRAVLEWFATRRTPEGGYRLENLFRVLVART
jgi:SAM-dependent methyltransferase